MRDAPLLRRYHLPSSMSSSAALRSRSVSISVKTFGGLVFSQAPAQRVDTTLLVYHQTIILSTVGTPTVYGGTLRQYPASRTKRRSPIRQQVVKLLTCR